MPKVFLNGSFVDPQQACVSVMDRGFLFGDGIYEVIPVYGGRLFRLRQHLKRLDYSLQGIRLENPYTEETWTGILNELVKRNPGQDQSVYLQLTRGVSPRRDHRFPAHTEPTVMAMSITADSATGEVPAAGVRAITLNDTRWQNCDIKAITLLPNILLRQRAEESGAAEAILLRDGWATEGAASNLFVVSNGLLKTPPKGPRLLPGITRDLILELAATNGVRFREADIPEPELRNAGEIWLTSSTREILPVTELDGAVVGDGSPGGLFHRMMTLFRDYKQALRDGSAV